MNQKKQAAAVSPSFNRPEIIAVAQGLLDYAVARNLLDSLPGDLKSDERADSLTSRTEHHDSTSAAARGAGVATNFFEVLVERARQIEHHLRVSGDSIRIAPAHGSAIFYGDDGDIQCIVGAVIEHDGFPGFVIDVDAPLVDEVVLAGGQRPAADLVRALSELVRLACELVGLAGGIDSSSRELVGFARQAVRALAVATADYRHHEGRDARDSSDTREKQGVVHPEIITSRNREADR